MRRRLPLLMQVTIACLAPAPIFGQFIPVERLDSAYVCANPPRALGDLTSSRQFVYELTTQEALSIGFQVGQASGARSRRFVVIDFADYKDCAPSDTAKVSTVRYGVAVRVLVDVRNFEAAAKFDLAWLAAAAQMGRAEALYTFEVKNASSYKIRAAYPAAGTFNVEKYGELVAAHRKIRDLFSDAETHIDPQPIAVELTPDELARMHIEKSASVWALSTMTSGMSCEDSKRIYKKKNGSAFESSLHQVWTIIEVTYRRVSRMCDSSLPDFAAQEKAKSYLVGLKLK